MRHLRFGDWKRSFFGFGIAAAALATSSAAAASPSGPHPRLWIGPSTLGAMKAKLGDPKSAASSVVVGCDHVLLKPNEMQQAGVQGYNWAYSGATCALAWRLTGDAKYATPAVTIFRALLDDYQTIGDGAGGDDVVQHDTGYGMRFFGAYSAVLYDWLHDAPGVDDALLAHARARFAAWTDWYTASGYLNSTPGSNYHSGYVFAKTLISVAEGGEDGARADAYWADVIGNLFPKQLVANGLAPKGALAGGDWPEGWQYGTMSSMDYALAARAVAEQGVLFPELRAWADALAVRYVHGMNPARDGMWVGGDIDDDRIDAPLNPRPLIGVIVGPSSDQAAAWAMHVKQTAATDPDLCPVYDALAEARGVAAADYRASAPPTTYVASGTRTVYTRTSWDPAATQAVFTSAPRLVPDHQHFDASNFVLTRGADHLVVDPSPYGSRSSLTANAMTVQSRAVESSYAPSQSPWGSADMPWARATKDGVVAARGELEGAFAGDGTPSDVAFARRDWTFLPEGEVVTIDRVRTDDATRGALLRFRGPANLAASGDGAVGTVGGSKLAIHAVARSGGTPSVAPIAVGNCWASTQYGQCDVGRFAATEWAIALPGPAAYAVHVLDALGASEAPAEATSMRDAAIDGHGENDGVLGARVRRGGRTSFVLASAAQSAASIASMRYGTPGDVAARHVVFDAPEDASGASTVTATASGDRCSIAITPGGPGAIVGRPLVFDVAPAAQGCAVNGAVPAPIGGGATGGGSSGGGATGGQGDGSGSDGTSGASSGGATPGGAAGAAGAGATNAGATNGGGAAASNGDTASANDGGGCSASGRPLETGEALLVLGGIALLLQGRRRAEEDDVARG